MAIVIDINLGGNQAVHKGLSQVSADLEKISKQLDTVGAKLRGLGTGAGGGQSNALARQINASSRAASQALGPMQRLVKAQQQLATAIRSGNSAQIFDAKVALNRAQTAVGKGQAMLQPPVIAPPKNAYQQMIASSRMAIGPNGQMQIMPLVNKAISAGFTGNVGGVLNMAGGGMIQLATAASMAAPEIAVLAVAAAAAALTIRTAMETLNERGTSQFKSGATGAQAAKLDAIAAGLGISPTEASSLARHVQEVASSNAYAAGFAGSRGANITGGPFGNLNAADTFIRVIKALADPKQTGNQEATRLARIYGVEDQVANLRNLSPKVRAKAMADMGKQLSPQAITEAADAQYALNKALYDFKMQLTELGQGILPGVTKAIEANNKINNVRADLWDAITHPFDRAKRVKLGNDFTKNGNPVDANAKSIKDLRDALNNNTNAIKDGQNVGGGHRTGRAIPVNYGGQYYDRQRDALGRSMGAYTL